MKMKMGLDGLKSDDSNPLINPNQDEFWNGLDDDCDEQIDEEIDRLSYILGLPTNRYSTECDI